jgi:hypothetical protein
LLHLVRLLHRRRLFLVLPPGRAGDDAVEAVAVVDDAVGATGEALVESPRQLVHRGV